MPKGLLSRKQEMFVVFFVFSSFRAFVINIFRSGLCGYGFGHWLLEFEIYLLFGACHLEFSMFEAFIMKSKWP
jgi:hypothetical protein